MSPCWVFASKKERLRTKLRERAFGRTSDICEKKFFQKYVFDIFGRFSDFDLADNLTDLDPDMWCFDRICLSHCDHFKVYRSTDSGSAVLYTMVAARSHHLHTVACISSTANFCSKTGFSNGKIAKFRPIFLPNFVNPVRNDAVTQRAVIMAYGSTAGYYQTLKYHLLSSLHVREIFKKP